MRDRYTVVVGKKEMRKGNGTYRAAGRAALGRAVGGRAALGAGGVVRVDEVHGFFLVLLPEGCCLYANSVFWSRGMVWCVVGKRRDPNWELWETYTEVRSE